MPSGTLDEFAITFKPQILRRAHHCGRIHSHLFRKLIDCQEDGRPQIIVDVSHHSLPLFTELWIKGVYTLPKILTWIQLLHSVSHRHSRITNTPCQCFSHFLSQGPNLRMICILRPSPGLSRKFAELFYLQL